MWQKSQEQSSSAVASSGMNDLLGLDSTPNVQTTFDPWGNSNSSSSSGGGGFIPQAQQVSATSSNPFQTTTSTSSTNVSTGSDPWGSQSSTNNGMSMYVKSLDK